MPDTQAYSVDWTVTVAPEGDVSRDVTEITYTRENGNPNSVTVTLDTSQRPHALEEQATISVELSDANETVTFDGFVDDVDDSPDEPTVTLDARTDEGRLDDGTVVGRYNKDNLWDVIDGIMDTGPSQIRAISFDAAAAKDEHGLFAGQTDFGHLSISHYGQFGVNSDTFNQHETITDTRGQQAELRVDYYENTTATTYTMDLVGKDADGNTVTASLDLPPASDAQSAFGTDRIKLALAGGNERWAEVNSVETDIPDVTGDVIVSMGANVTNYVKTDYQFSPSKDSTHADVLDRLTTYIESLDDGQPWEYYVDDAANELIVQPEETEDPSKYTFTEGQNVIRPMAKRNLDGVKNYVQVSGAGGVNVWIWAYNGAFYIMWGRDDPHARGVYPDDTSDTYTWKWKDSAGTNDIDEIDLRATFVSDQQITGWYQALAVAKNTMDDVYRTSVSGTAPVTGIFDAEPGDKAEVFYPSRGIPQKVTDNTYTVEKVEYHVKPQEAKTAIEFGVKRKTASEVIGDVAITELIKRQKSGASGSGVLTPSGGDGSGFTPTVGTIDEVNGDGTVDIDAEDGETYEDVRIV